MSTRRMFTRKSRRHHVEKMIGRLAIGLIGLWSAGCAALQRPAYPTELTAATFRTIRIADHIATPSFLYVPSPDVGTLPCGAWPHRGNKQDAPQSRLLTPAARKGSNAIGLTEAGSRADGNAGGCGDAPDRGRA